MRYDAVILDSDGVIVEPPSAETLRTAAGDLLDRVDLDADPGAFARAFFDGDVDALAERCRASGADLSAVCQRAATVSFETQRREVERGVRSVYDDLGALAALEAPLGLVSDNQPQFVAYLLRRFDLAGLFETVRCRTVTPRGLRRAKPDPRNLGAALADLDAERAVYVGDRPADAEAAHRLGLDSVRLVREDDGGADGHEDGGADGNGDGDDWPVDPDYRVDGLDELPAVVG